MAGNVYVADTANNLIRKITSTGAVGELAVAWSPSVDGVSYTAYASAPGQPTETCSVEGLLCTISGLTSGVEYAVTVTAMSAVGESKPSGSVTAVPN